MKHDERVLEMLGALRLVPVVAIEDAGKAAPLAEALIEGGLPCAEITFRTEAALDAIRAAAAVEGMLVGAGTVLTVDQASRAVEAGARFVVSPGLDRDVVRWCQETRIPVFPGVATPTELMAALGLGLEVVKLFPAEVLGGPSMLKALAGPFPSARFIPTGGVNASNLGAWLASPRVLACGGSWMAEKGLIRGGDFDEIARRTREAVALVPSP